MDLNVQIIGYQLPSEIDAGFADEFLFYASGQLLTSEGDNPQITYQGAPSQPMGGPMGQGVTIAIETDFDFTNLSFGIKPEFGATDSVSGEIIELQAEYVLNIAPGVESYIIGTFVGGEQWNGGGNGGALLFGYPEAYGGCTDPEAFNCDTEIGQANCSTCPDISGCPGYYDETALFDDGSCIKPVYGCTDPRALNYGYDADGNYHWEDGASIVSVPDGSCIYYNPTYTLTPNEIQEPGIGNIDVEVTVVYDNTYPDSALSYAGANAQSFTTVTHNHSINTNAGFSLNNEDNFNTPTEVTDDTTTFLFDIDIPSFPDASGTAPNIQIDDNILLIREDGHQIGIDAIGAGVEYYLSDNADPITVEILETEDVYLTACTDSDALNYYCYGSSLNQTTDDNLCPFGVIPNQVTSDNSLCNYTTTFVANANGDSILSQPIIFNIEDNYDGYISFFVHDINITDDVSMNNHLTGFQIFNASQEYSVVGTTPELVFRGNNISELRFPISAVSEDNLGTDSEIRDVTVITEGDLSGITEVTSYSFLGPQFTVTVVEGNDPPVFTDSAGNDVSSYEVTINEDETATFDVYVSDPNIVTAEGLSDLSIEFDFNNSNILNISSTNEFEFGSGLVHYTINVTPQQNFFTSAAEVITITISDTSPIGAVGTSHEITTSLNLSVNKLEDDRPLTPPSITHDIFAGEQSLDFNLPCQAVGEDKPDFYIIFPYFTSFVSSDSVSGSQIDVPFDFMRWVDSLFAQSFTATLSDGTEFENIYEYNVDEYLRDILFDAGLGFNALPEDGEVTSTNELTYDWWQHMYVIELGDSSEIVPPLDNDTEYDSYITISYKADITNQIVSHSQFFYTCGKYTGAPTSNPAFLFADLDGDPEGGFDFYAYGTGNLANTGGGSDSYNYGFWPQNSDPLHFSRVKINFQYGEYDGDFGVPGVDIYPSLNESFDPYSGMDIDTDLLENTRDGFDGADDDKRPSLGCFYYDEDNFAIDNFTYDIRGDEFLTYEKINFVSNGNGRMIKSISDEIDVYNPEGELLYSLDNVQKPLGGWRYMNLTGGENNSSYNDSFVQRCDDFGNVPYDFSGGFAPCLKYMGYYSSQKFCEDFDNQSDCNSYTPYGSLDVNPCSWSNSECTETDFSGEWARWIYNDSECHSFGTCLYMKSTGDFYGNWDVASGGTQRRNQYVRLNQWQELLDKEEANSLLNRFSSLTVSFWMKTTSAEIATNKPAIEVSITKKGNPANGNIDAGDDNAEYYITEGLYNSTLGDYNFTNTATFSIGSRILTQNTELDTWEKFTFTFGMARQHLYGDGQLAPLYLVVGWSNLDYPEYNGDVWDQNHGEVYLDDFEVYESYDFIPDVDVRVKEGPNNYSEASLTEYYDPTIDAEKYKQTSAPLEAQFYFYPRYPFDDIFDMSNKQIIHNDFRNFNFYVYNVDWGDGEPIEFSDEPEQIGENISLYHTYKKSGIYEITGYMLRLKKDSQANSYGVITNQRFTVRINVNEGLDEDFMYFGSEKGFSFIPYKNTLPIVGGISEQSSYYKDVKREIGFVGDDKLSTFFERESDKLKTELALLKMDSSIEDEDFEILPEFQIKRYEIKGSESDEDLIYSGISPLAGELGSSVGDVDLTNIRYFNKPMEMWEQLGFPCDEFSPYDTIPLSSPEYGINYSHHSHVEPNTAFIEDPNGEYKSTRLYHSDGGGNEIRFGYRFQVTDDGYGDWGFFSGTNSGISGGTFLNPNLQVGETYTFSTHVYVPSVNPVTGAPQNENDFPNAIRVSQVQTCYRGLNLGTSDWLFNVRDDDGTFNNSQGLDIINIGTEEEPILSTQEYSFSDKKYECYTHCHPMDAEIGEYYWGTASPNPYPMTNVRENGLTCYSALTEAECDGDCYWYDAGMLEGSYKDLLEISTDEIVYDTWNRISFTFTPEPYNMGDMLSLRFTTNIGDGTWGTCYCQTDWEGEPAECLVEDGGGILWDVSSNFLVEDIYSNDSSGDDVETNFTYAQEQGSDTHPTDGLAEFYWNNDEYVKIIVRDEATYNWRHRLVYKNGYNSFSNSLDTLIPPVNELLHITPDNTFRLTGKIRGCQIDTTTGQCSDHIVTSRHLFGLRGFANHSFRGNAAQREITIGSESGLDEWVEIDYEFQVGEFVPCICSVDWNNIDDLHNEDNCPGTIINLDVCNEEVYCREDNTCNNHNSTTCTSETEYGVSGEGGCVIAPYLSFPEIGTLSNEYQQLHDFTTFEPANDLSAGSDWRNEIHVKDLELRYIQNDIDAMSCDEFGGFWTGTLNGEDSHWLNYESNCNNFDCNGGGGTAVWDTLRDINDSVYVWGAQLEIGNETSPYTTEDINFSDCIEVDSAVPFNDRYWKNIAPTFDDILDGTYYYPVLPEFNQKGEFIQTKLQDEKIPFGGIQYNGMMWSPADTVSPITNDVTDNSLKIEIKTEDVENNIIMDNSGNKNFGFTINDYNMNFDLETREPSKRKSTRRFKKSRNNGAF